MKYDVRVVRFIKTTSSCPVNKNEHADYICLGHFDMMHISKLGDLTEAPLLEIQNDRGQKGESVFGCTENNVYSLYILKDITEFKPDKLSSFWTASTTYTVVTRIHCDYPTTWSKEKQPFSQVIEDHCKKQVFKNARVVLRQSEDEAESPVFSFDSAINQENTKKEKVDCLFYGSLELGDTVAIMKSCSIRAILEVIYCLSSNECVRDTYSYCGIDRVLLQNNNVLLSAFSVSDAMLDYISTRFYVRNIKNADIFMGMLYQQTGKNSAQFYVTGTADQSIHWNECTEEGLLTIMRFLTQKGEDIHYCFNDVITRIGICQKPMEQGDYKLPDKEIRKLSEVIEGYDVTMDWLRKEYETYSEINWKYSLLKLLGTLESLHTNYVMDDLANLTIPSVNAFLIRLNYIREQNNDTIPEKYDNEIIKFLNRWTSLMNEISHLESQLTQHPEFVPVKYYVPAMILQFELQFVKCCCQALSMNQSRLFVPMLLPIDYPDLHTYCPLDPKQEDYGQSCPLLLFIPLMDLYRPWETAFRIAHEMAHYCEDNSRNRNLRHKLLIKCAAEYVANCWYGTYIAKEDGSEASDLRVRSKDYALTLQKRMEEAISSQHPAEQYYLDDTIDYLADIVSAGIRSTIQLEEYLFTVDPKYFFNHQKMYTKIHMEQEQSSRNHVLNDMIGKHLELLRFLYSECYADTAMVILTGCSFDDYVSSIYIDQYTRFEQAEPKIGELLKNPYVLRQVVRMALVIYAIDQLPNNDNSWHPDDILKINSFSSNLVKYSVKIVKDIKEKKTTPPEVLDDEISVSVDEFLCIRDYLITCASDLANSLQNPGEMKTKEPDRQSQTNSKRYEAVQYVRSGISYVKRNAFDWTRVQKYILEMSDYFCAQENPCKKRDVDEIPNKF